MATTTAVWLALVAAVLAPSASLAQNPSDAIVALISKAAGAKFVSMYEVDTLSGAKKLIADLPEGLYVSSTDGRVVVEDKKDSYHVALMDLHGKPHLVSVDATGAKPTVTSVPIKGECLLWQLLYNSRTHQLYGISISDPKNGTLFRIEPKTGFVHTVGNFPFVEAAAMAAAKQVVVQQPRRDLGKCYEMLGGGTLVDSDKNAFWLHFGDGVKGMYIQQISLHDAKVGYHGIYPIDFTAPAWDRNKIFSLTYETKPPYPKHLAVLDLTTGKNHVFDDTIPFKTFYGNLAAFDIHGQRYSCVMGKNITEPFHLVSLSREGKVVGAPALSREDVLWNLFSPQLGRGPE